MMYEINTYNEAKNDCEKVVTEGNYVLDSIQCIDEKLTVLTSKIGSLLNRIKPIMDEDYPYNQDSMTEEESNAKCPVELRLENLQVRLDVVIFEMDDAIKSIRL